MLIKKRRRYEENKYTKRNEWGIDPERKSHATRGRVLFLLLILASLGDLKVLGTDTSKWRVGTDDLGLGSETTL